MVDALDSKSSVERRVRSSRTGGTTGWRVVACSPANPRIAAIPPPARVRIMNAPAPKPSGESPLQEHELHAIQVKRVRLLASLTLIGGIGLVLALPFALRSGAEFFMPVTAALVVAIALVPMLEWFERRGVPSRLA